MAALVNAAGAFMAAMAAMAASANDTIASVSASDSGFWSRVLSHLAHEFADLADLSQLGTALVRLLTAALLGGLIGYEREHKGKAAGVRTHILVASGAALFVLVPLQGGMLLADLSRVIQGVISGIGFLGAGAIIKHRQQDDVEGLTTAASVWMAAAIGVTCALGHAGTALLSTLLTLGVLALLPRWVRRRPP